MTAAHHSNSSIAFAPAGSTPAGLVISALLLLPIGCRA